jgi:hypothetical protein
MSYESKEKKGEASQGRASPRASPSGLEPPLKRARIEAPTFTDAQEAAMGQVTKGRLRTDMLERLPNDLFLDLVQFLGLFETHRRLPTLGKDVFVVKFMSLFDTMQITEGEAKSVTKTDERKKQFQAAFKMLAGELNTLHIESQSILPVLYGSLSRLETLELCTDTQWSDRRNAPEEHMDKLLAACPKLTSLSVPSKWAGTQLAGFQMTFPTRYDYPPTRQMGFDHLFTAEGKAERKWKRLDFRLSETFWRDAGFTHQRMLALAHPGLENLQWRAYPKHRSQYFPQTPNAVPLSWFGDFCDRVEAKTFTALWLPYPIEPAEADDAVDVLIDRLPGLQTLGASQGPIRLSTRVWRRVIKTWPRMFADEFPGHTLVTEMTANQVLGTMEDAAPLPLKILHSSHHEWSAAPMDWTADEYLRLLRCSTAWQSVSISRSPLQNDEWDAKQLETVLGSSPSLHDLRIDGGVCRLTNSLLLAMAEPDGNIEMGKQGEAKNVPIVTDITRQTLLMVAERAGRMRLFCAVIGTLTASDWLAVAEARHSKSPKYEGGPILECYIPLDTYRALREIRRSTGKTAYYWATEYQTYAMINVSPVHARHPIRGGMGAYDEKDD